MTTDVPPPAPDRDRRRVILFCLFAFAIAGATALLIGATGGLRDSRPLLPGTPVTVAVVLLPTAYMFAPATAHLLTRLLTREGWSGLGLRPHLGAGRWRYLLLAWLAPALLTAAGALLFFLVHPERFDPAAAPAAQAGAQQRQPGPAGPPLTPGTLLALQVGLAIVVAPWVNALFAIGEEFGWRAYLLPKLVALTGPRRAVLGSGLIWGCWHWPLILLGYEYGFGYPGAPWSGLATFCLFTVAVGTFLAWLVLRSGNVWPAALAHGSLNATATVPLLLTAGQPDLLVGPVAVGLLSMVPWLVTALLLLPSVARFPQGVLTPATST